jgi:hypothetical protein
MLVFLYVLGLCLAACGATPPTGSFSPAIVYAGQNTTISLFALARCRGTEQVECPPVASSGLSVACDNPATTCRLIPNLHLWPSAGGFVNRPYGRPVLQCLGLELNHLRPSQCNYELEVISNSSVTADVHAHFSLNGEPYTSTLSVKHDIAVFAVEWNIPNNALRYTKAAANHKLNATLSGPTIKEINAHFVKFGTPGYICCNGAVQASDGVVVTSTMQNKTVISYPANIPITNRTTTFVNISRVTTVVYNNELVQVSVALNNTQTRTQEGLTPAACLMAPIEAANTTKPFAVCQYNADLSAWSPNSLASNPITEITLTYQVMKDGPPVSLTTGQFTAWQATHLLTYSTTVNILPWTLPAAGFGQASVSPQTRVCAQTGCDIHVHAHVPSPVFTNQPVGGADGFQMIGVFTFPNGHVKTIAVNASTHPLSLATADHVAPNKLYQFWYVTYRFELDDIVNFTSSNPGVHGTANFYGTFWNYTSATTDGPQQWQAPAVGARASLQYTTTLSFYDPAVHTLLNTTTTVTVVSAHPSVIQFSVPVIRGLSALALPATPLLFPSLYFRRKGATDGATFYLDGSPSKFVTYALGSFAATGFFVGRIDLTALLASPQRARFEPVLQIGATLELQLRPPYFEGATTPGGAWYSPTVFPSPLHVTREVTPFYDASTANCVSQHNGTVARNLQINFLCTFTVDVTKYAVVDHFQINATSATATVVVDSHPILDDNCTTTNLAGSRFNETICTVQFAHSFHENVTSFTTIIATRNLASGTHVQSVSIPYDLTTVPSIIDHPVVLSPSVVVLGVADELLPPFNLTTPVGLAVTEVPQPTSVPGFVLTLDYSGGTGLQHTNTTHIADGDGGVTKTSQGVYTISLGSAHGFAYEDLKFHDFVTITLEVSWWDGTVWRLPTHTITTWPLLKTTLAIHNTAEIATLVPEATPAIATEMARPVHGWAKATTILMGLLALFMTVTVIFVVSLPLFGR